MWHTAAVIKITLEKDGVALPESASRNCSETWLSNLEMCCKRFVLLTRMRSTSFMIQHSLRFWFQGWMSDSAQYSCVCAADEFYMLVALLSHCGSTLQRNDSSLLMSSGGSQGRLLSWQWSHQTWSSSQVPSAQGEMQVRVTEVTPESSREELGWVLSPQVHAWVTKMSLKLHWSQPYISNGSNDWCERGLLTDKPKDNRTLQFPSSMERFGIFQLSILFLQSVTLLFWFSPTLIPATHGSWSVERLPAQQTTADRHG